MQNYVIMCGSTADLTLEFLNKRNIEYIPFRYYIDGVEHIDDLGQNLSYKDFYDKIRNGSITKTTQITTPEYLNYFKKVLEKGQDLIYVSLSSGISGTYNAALLAKKELDLKYPERKLFVVDSLGASSGYGLLMDKLATLRDEGKTIEEVRDYAENNKLRINHLFFSTDLTCYVRGGRVSKTMGLVGTILKICPLLHVDREGKLTVVKKIRTKKKTMEETIRLMTELCDDGLDYNENCFISNSDCLDDAIYLKDRLEELFPNLKGKILINSIGTTIGSHSGPGTIALFFFGKERDK